MRVLRGDGKDHVENRQPSVSGSSGVIEEGPVLHNEKRPVDDGEGRVHCGQIVLEELVCELARWHPVQVHGSGNTDVKIVQMIVHRRY